MGEFEEFWAVCARKEARIAAQKAFTKARKVATLYELIHGMQEYIKHKPSYQDYCLPATFLNQGRWLDEYGSNGQPLEAAEDWFDSCKRLHGLKCGGQYAHGLRMRMDRK